jgi:hypothetical protein
MNRTKYTDAHIIITEKFWNEIDKDKDEYLNIVELKNAIFALDKGMIFGNPFLVYPTLSTRHITNFRSEDKELSDISVFGLMPSSVARVPHDANEWQQWYDSTLQRYNEFSLSTFPAVSNVSGLVTFGISELPESEKYTLPLATLRNGKILLNKHIYRDTRVLFNNLTHGIASQVFPSKIEIHGIEQIPDIVHNFNEDSTEKIIPIKHRGIAGDEIEDNTAVIVTGMVRFPADRTQNYVCGLQFATVTAYKGKKCNSEELKIDGLCSPKGYQYETEPDVYRSDDLGRFDISLTPGETWVFIASYEGHDICYGGDELDDFACDVKDVPPLKFNQVEYHQNVFVELEKIEGGEKIIFFDVTERQIDIGLYAGACSTQYSEYSLMITPANGCGSTVIIPDKDIKSSMFPLVNPEDQTSNLRYWPYAAMDYYIQLENAPDVSSLNEKSILDSNEGASCTPPGSNIMQFFRDRNVLVQTLLLLERARSEVKYVYHGWLCALPKFGGNKAATKAFTKIRKDEICLGKDIGTEDLTLEHLIGTSNLEYSKLNEDDVSKNKYVSLKVMEAHLTKPGEVAYCSTFSTTINDQATKLGISVQIQQDIGPQGEENKCHSSSEPSPDCVFTDVNPGNGQLQFENDAGDPLNSFVINSTDALPNLVKPHRRKFLARIERNDGWAVTNLAIERELVTLSSKIRGGGDPKERYISDTKFYATAPIRGLVYTVVHDPPGGNSFASISQGTHIDLELGLVTTRAVSRGNGFDFAVGIDVSGEVDMGFSAGSSYANAEASFGTAGKENEGLAGFEIESSGGREADGPAVTASAETDNGWDLHMTLNRNLESSQEPGLPGRPGDIILGGGFEIVYVKTDTVDIRSNCLKIVEEVQWFPRKPTSYVISVFSIEERILKELQGLVGVANSSSSIISDQEMSDKQNAAVKKIWKKRLEQSIKDWENTIEWTSPDFNPSNANTMTLKEEAKDRALDKFKAISVPFTSNKSVFGRLMQPKINDAFAAYTQDDSKKVSENDYSAGEDWEDLSDVWNSIPSNNVPKIRRDDSFKDYDGWTANAAAAGRGAAVGSALGPTGAIVGALTGAIVDRVLNPNPQGYMDDIALDVVKAEGLDEENNNGRWMPVHGSWLETYEKTGAEKGKNVFTSVENDDTAVPGSLFSRGMSENAVSQSDLNDEETIFMENDETSALIDASIFGSSAKFRFEKGEDPAEPYKNPKPDGADQFVYLTFSGGGHTLEFSSSISSNIDSWGYSWSFEAEAEISNKWDTSGSLSLATAEFNINDAHGKSASMEHAMAWAKYGDLEVKYALGDGDPFDKFVIQVSADKRFGTPIFRIIGGSSKCPGEPNTMWRESGLIVETVWAAGVNNKFIPPGQNALYDVMITNESPYREGHIYNLLLTAGLSYTGDFGGNMMDLTFNVNGKPLAPFSTVLPLHDVPSVDDDGKLKYTRLSLNIGKGKFAHEYGSIGVQLVSECEWQMSRDWLYRSPISSTAYLGDFKWERECPKVNWDSTTYNAYLNAVFSKKTSPYVNVTLMNPDPLNLWSADFVKGDLKKTNHLVHPNVEFVRVQWRKLGQGEWINSWDMVGEDSNIWKRDVKDADVQCKSARGEGCGFKWNLERQYFLNGLKDGAWEIRAKVFCSGYDSFATSEVKGSVTEENLNLVVDVSDPVPLSAHLFNHVFTIDYSEKIICPQLQADHMAYTIEHVKGCDGKKITNGVVSGSDTFFKYKFSCLDNGDRSSLMIQFPESVVTGTYQVTVNADLHGSKIVDAGGNAARRENFSTTVGLCEKTSQTVATSLLGLAKDEENSTNKDYSLQNLKGLKLQQLPLVKAYAIVLTIAFLSLFVFQSKKNIALKKALEEQVPLTIKGEIKEEEVSRVYQYGSVL